jgi:murein DD-endopeptidase MepM/ murein hydrolase activator NlpD
MKYTLLVLFCACAASEDKIPWPAEPPTEAAASAPPAHLTCTECQAAAVEALSDNDREAMCAAGAADCTENPLEESAKPRVRFAWPLEARAITSGFGLRADPIEPEQTRFHRGVDLSAHYGAMVRAAAAGLVTDGRWAGGYGQHVSITHGQGWVTSYSHLSLLLVSPGMWVEQGDPIGLVGESGRTTGPHLHFELMNAKGVVNPLRYLPRDAALSAR